MKGSYCGLHINTINIECLQEHCTDYTFSSVTQLLEKKCSLSDVFDACLSYCYTTSKQTNERSLQFYLQLWKAARSPNLSSLAPGCSPKSHSSDSLRLPVPGNLLQPWTNPQKDTLITRAHTYTATFRGNKSLRQTSGTTHQTGRFLLNAAIFDKLSRLQEWLRCNINLHKKDKIKKTARRIVPFSYIEKSKRLLLTGHLICAAVMGLPWQETNGALRGALIIFTLWIYIRSLCWGIIHSEHTGPGV